MSIAKGSRAFYRITEAVRDFLLTLEEVNTVTYGDITDVDLNKHTMYPLSHVMVNNVTLADGSLTFNMTILAMDIVHKPTYDEDRGVDLTFYGADNEQDVLNTQLAVVNLLNQSLSRARLRGDGFELTGLGSCEPFTDRFENKVAGWAYTFSAYVQNDISNCD